MTSRQLTRLACRLGTQLLLRQSYTLVPKTRLIRTVQPIVNRCMSSSSAAVKFEVLNVQDGDDFQTQVLESKIPVVVDFHATWCGPCKLLGPRLESLISTKNGRIKLAKIDVDNNAEIAAKYEVQSVPTLLGMKNGKVLDTFIGLQEDDKLNTFLEKLLN